MKRIIVEVIDHKDQRYDTVGDWQFLGDDLIIRVSDLGDWRYNFLVGRHELDEAMLCKHFGVTQEQVDAYDNSHLDAGGDELSACSDSPYFVQHNSALAAEWVMSQLLEVDWRTYGEAIDKLTWNEPDSHLGASEEDSNTDTPMQPS